MIQKLMIILGILILSTITLPAQADYQRYRMNLIENGGFECTEPDGESVGAYWLTRGRGNLPEVPRDLMTDLDSFEGQYSLVVSQSDSVWQYLPGVQEYADSLTIHGAVKLTGTSPSARLHLTSADGKSVVYIFGANPNPPQNDSLHVFIGMPTTTESWIQFTLNAGIDFLTAFGENPFPRFTLLIEGMMDYCLFDAFEVTSDFYTLPPEELKEKILDEMAWTFDLWIEYGLDREGPENTPCVSHLHDAITGEEVQTLTMCPVWASYPIMIEYLQYRENAEYRQLVIDQADLFLRTRNRTTGLTQYWNPATDEPTGTIALLPISYFWQVYDLTGDVKYRDAAIELTDSVLIFDERAWNSMPIQEGYLQSGLNVDGSISQLHENQYQIMIRWFDTVRILANTYKRNPNTYYLEAMEKCAELYITPGTVDYADIDPSTITFDPTWYSWHNLIPAFDDYFGYDIQGLWMIWEAGGFTHTGIEDYLKKAFADMGGEWWKAMFLGGREAGDEFRGWRPYFWMWQHDTESYTDLQELLVRNGYTIMKGEFGEYGSWMGTGYEDWSPIIGLPGEGGTTGASGNALSGLYLAWIASGQDEDFYAAMVTLFRTSQLTYKFDFGYIRTPTPDPEGPNTAGGEFRYLNCWFDILEALELTGVDKSIKVDSSTPDRFYLHQNTPNPFNTQTMISFTIPYPCHITLTVYNLMGKEVRCLTDDLFQSGNHQLTWNGRDQSHNQVSSGIYMIKMNSDHIVKTCKCLLLK